MHEMWMKNDEKCMKKNVFKIARSIEESAQKINSNGEIFATALWVMTMASYYPKNNTRLTKQRVATIMVQTMMSCLNRGHAKGVYFRQKRDRSHNCGDL